MYYLLNRDYEIVKTYEYYEDAVYYSHGADVVSAAKAKRLQTQYAIGFECGLNSLSLPARATDAHRHGYTEGRNMRLRNSDFEW